MQRYLSLVAFIAIVAAVGFAAGQYMPGVWYAGLVKPSWTPPNGLFAPVWSVLYLMISVAGWLVWSGDAAPKESGAAKWLWPAQLILNGMWSPIMFGWHRIGMALIVIGLLWVTIAAFIGATWTRQRTAGLLFVPYLAWVSYASALNFALWWLNG
jgi:translocator protein